MQRGRCARRGREWRGLSRARAGSACLSTSRGGRGGFALVLLWILSRLLVWWDLPFWLPLLLMELVCCLSLAEEECLASQNHGQCPSSFCIIAKPRKSIKRLSNDQEVRKTSFVILTMMLCWLKLPMMRCRDSVSKLDRRSLNCLAISLHSIDLTSAGQHHIVSESRLDISNVRNSHFLDAFGSVSSVLTGSRTSLGDGCYSILTEFSLIHCSNERMKRRRFKPQFSS